MKVEKINDNKVKITLTIDELEEREVSLADIQQNATKARQLFLNLLEETELSFEFLDDDGQLFIEASTNYDDSFVITITKIDNIPEISKYKPSSKVRKINGNAEKIKYCVSCNIYEFSNIDSLLDFSEKAMKEKLFFGYNDLYKYNDKYFLMFSKNAISNKKFLKTYVILSEYCNSYYSLGLYNSLIKEKSNKIISRKAVQTLANI